MSVNKSELVTQPHESKREGQGQRRSIFVSNSGGGMLGKRSLI